MGSLLQDLRYSYRLFLRYPGVTVVALLSLALGVGANTTIFSVLNTVLLRPFPVKEPERLAVLFERNLQQGDDRVPTAAAFEEWRKQTQAFEDMALTGMGGGEPATLTGTKEAIRISYESVGTNFFSVVGIAPALGRAFLPEDAPPYGRAIVLSNGFWQRQYGGDRNIIGQTVAVEGKKVTIIGVMPRGFWLLPWASDTDVWGAENPGKNLDTRWLTPIGRLRPGATLAQAEAELETFFMRLAREQPDVYKGWGIRVESLHEWAVGDSRKTLYLLLGAVGFVLLIGCANVANLLLARATARRKEIAVRSSLGAGRLRLIRQLLTESLLLALAGGTLGVLVAWWGIDLFIALAPEWFPRRSDITIDTTVLGFTLLLSLLTGFVFGLVPAIQASRPDLNESLKEGGRSTGGIGSRGRSLLVVTEVALALVLLMGAGLMINSFIRLQSVDLGFDPKNALKAEIFLAGPKYWNDIGGDTKRVTPQADLLFQQMLERAERLPGVVSAGIGSLGLMPRRPFRIAGRPPQAPKDQPQASFADVSPGYFRTMGIPLLKGRTLSDRDGAGTPWVVVVSESFVQRFFPNEDPLGKLLNLTIRVDEVNRSVEEDRPREIVGVVGDVRYWGPTGRAPLVMYGSYLQHPWEYPRGFYSFHLWTKLILRTTTNPTSLIAPVQRIVAELDKDQVVFDVMPLERMVSTFVAPQRFWMQLFGIFGGLAVFLAVVGIYGVMSYSVERRSHEIGIRMATGAQRRDILKLVVGHGLKLALIGVAIGIGVSLALTRLVAQFLYEVKPTDTPTFIVVAIVLTAVALGAAYIPARRAAKVDPMVALRYE